VIGRGSPYLDRFVRRVCVVVPEYRGPKLEYPVGALILGVLLCECAGRLSQRSKARWLEKHWHWIKKMWLAGGGQRITAKGTPSQSTISRLLSMFSEETFARLVYDDERRQLWSEWDAYLKRCKADVLGRRKKKASQEIETSSAVLLRWQSSQGLQESSDGAGRDRCDHLLPRNPASAGQAHAGR
jgi:hypothetical protein